MLALAFGVAFVVPSVTSIGVQTANAASKNYVLRDYSFPFFGVYAACSTMTESLILGSMLMDASYGNYILCSA